MAVIASVVATTFRGYIINETVALKGADRVHVWVGGCQILFSAVPVGTAPTIRVYAWGNKLQDATEFLDLRQAELFAEEAEEAEEAAAAAAAAAARRGWRYWLRRIFGGAKAAPVTAAPPPPARSTRRNPELANPRHETWRWGDAQNLFVALMTSGSAGHDLCSVQFLLPPEYRFDTLRMKALDSRGFVHIHADITVKAAELLEITALHANVDLEHSVEARRLQFKLRDGYLSLALDGDPGVYDFGTDNALQIDSRTAPIFIRGSIPMDIVLTEQQATRLFVRAYEIDAAPLGGSGASSKMLRLTGRTERTAERRSESFSIRLPYRSQSPLYIELRDLDERTKRPLVRSLDQGWAGVEHIDAPHLLSYSASLVQDIRAGLRQDRASPWLLNIYVISPWLDVRDFWRFVSSAAYVSGSVGWFTVLSAGLLAPRYWRTQLHVLGCHCRGPDHALSLANLNAFRTNFGVYTDLDAADDDLFLIARRYQERWPAIYPGQPVGRLPSGGSCEQAAVDAVYVVLWKALGSVAAARALMLYIRRGAAAAIKFRLSSDVVMREPIRIADTWLFDVAAAVNLIASLTAAGLILAHYAAPLMRAIKQHQDRVRAEVATSHRLVQTLQEDDIHNGAATVEDDRGSGDWIINVAEIQFPGHGVCVKWNEPYAPQTVRLALCIAVAAETGGGAAAAGGEAAIAEEAQALLDEPAAALIRAELMVLYFPLKTAAETVLFGMRHFELRIPRKHPSGDFRLSSDQSYELHFRRLYRFRLVCTNSEGRVCSSSRWSEDFVLDLPQSFYRVPLHFLTSQNERLSSLRLFAARHLDRQTVHRVLVHFSDLALTFEGGGAPRESALKLVMYTGSFEQAELRRWQSRNWNMNVYTEVELVGSVDEMGRLILPQFSAAVAIEFTCSTSHTWQLHDHATGHLLARGSMNDREWIKQAAAQFRAGMAPGHSWQLNWAPRCVFPLFQGRDSARRWATVSVNCHPVTARWYCNHDFGTGALVRFVDDTPGLAFPAGHEIVLRWIWSLPAERQPAVVTLKVHDHVTHEQLHVLENVPNSGSLCWGLDVPLRRRNRQIYFSLLNLEGQQLAKSNGLNVIEVLTLSAFEFAYATFCRTFGYEMQHVSADALRELGLEVSTKPLKICANLRRPLPFENLTVGRYFHCPGQFIISTHSLVGRLPPAASQICVYKSVTKSVAWIENHYLSPDLELWLTCSDIDLNQHGLLPSSLYAHAREYLLGFGRPAPLDPFHGRSHAGGGRRPAASDYSPFQEHVESNFALPVNTVTPATKVAVLAPATVRRLLVNIAPSVLNLLLKFLLFLYYAWFAAFALAFLVQYNKAALETRVHYLPDPRYIHDIFFSQLGPLAFVARMPQPAPLLVTLAAVWALVAAAAVFVEPYNRDARVAGLLRCVGIFLQVIQSLTLLATAASFLLWFAVGALINSSRFLPYAVFLGSTIFVTYTLWCNYRQAADLVSHYIDENQQHLLSICFDRWFEAEGLDSEALLKDRAESRARLNTTFSLQVEQWRRRKLRHLTDQLVRRKDAAPAPSLSTNDDDDDDDDKSVSWDFIARQTNSGCLQCLLAARLRREVCWWELARVVADVAKGESFYLEPDGTVRGLDHLPRHTELASRRDLSRTSLEDLVVGFDSALLKDGVIYGPRLKFKTEPRAAPGQRFAICIVKKPVWAEPDVLEPFMKVSLILDFFDKHKHGSWNHANARAWVEKCGSNAAYAAFLRTAASDPSGELVLNPEDLERFYTNNSDCLDKDYLLLYGNAAPTSRLPLQSEGDDDDDVATTDFEAGGDKLAAAQPLLDGASEDESDCDADFDHDEDNHALQTDAPDRLNLNSLRLKYIYKTMTEKSRDPRITEIVQSVPYIAQNVVDLQFAVLHPIFGRFLRLGEDRRHAVTSQNDDGGRFLAMLKTLHCDLLREIHQRTVDFHAKLFERTRAQRVIGKYYDSDMVADIHLKVARLTDTRIDLSPNDLTHGNRWIVSYATVTAKQAMRSYSIHRSRSILQLRDKLQTVNMYNRPELRTSIIVEALLQIGVLRQSEVSISENEDITMSGMLPDTRRIATPARRMTIDVYRPVSQECGKLIANLVQEVVGSNPMTVNSVTELLEKICSEYLWLVEFRALLALCGIPFRENLLPGRVFDEPGSIGLTERGIESVVSDVLAITQIGNENELIKESIDNPELFKEHNVVEVKNICVMKRIFDKFSNFSCLLPIDLADEAILLLTDNKLPTSGIFPCLRNLQLGDLSYLRLTNVLESLEEIDPGGGDGADEAYVIEDYVGETLLRDEVRQMLQPSGNQETADRQTLGYESMLLPPDLDWSVYGISEFWPKALRDAYISLTVNSPGYISKSQLAELVHRVEILFSADAKLVCFQGFHSVLMEMGLTVSRKHSRLFWILVNVDLSCMTASSARFVKVAEVLRLDFVAHALTRILLQPCNAANEVLTLSAIIAHEPRAARSGETPLDVITSYSGYFALPIFQHLLKILGIDIAADSARNLWADIEKDPFGIHAFVDLVPADAPVLRRYAKINMDSAGLDPYRGVYAEIDRVRRTLPRLLLKGLWPAALRHLLKLNFCLTKAVELEPADLARWQTRHGLIPPERLPEVIEASNDSGGMNFQMLVQLIEQMDLELPPGESVKKLFDSLDVNRDGTLDMTELLNGFEVLLSRLLPIKLCDSIGLTLRHFWLKIAAVFAAMSTFFLFTGLSFSAFVSDSAAGAGSTTIQSVLALLGAVGLQSGASQDSGKVITEMKIKMENVLFPNSKRSTVHLEDQVLKDLRIHDAIALDQRLRQGIRAQHRRLQPVSLRYDIPKDLLPAPREPRPCLTVIIGEALKLEPYVVLSNGAIVRAVRGAAPPAVSTTELAALMNEGLQEVNAADARLVWTIRPAFPPASGLVFDYATGTIRADWRARLAPMPRRSFAVRVRNPGGTARTHLTLRTVQSL